MNIPKKLHHALKVWISRYFYQYPSGYHALMHFLFSRAPEAEWFLSESGFYELKLTELMEVDGIMLNVDLSTLPLNSIKDYLDDMPFMKDSQSANIEFHQSIIDWANKNIDEISSPLFKTYGINLKNNPCQLFCIVISNSALDLLPDPNLIDADLMWILRNCLSNYIVDIKRYWHIDPDGTYEDVMSKLEEIEKVAPTFKGLSSQYSKAHKVLAALNSRDDVKKANDIASRIVDEVISESNLD